MAVPIVASCMISAIVGAAVGALVIWAFRAGNADDQIFTRERQTVEALNTAAACSERVQELEVALGIRLLPKRSPQPTVWP